jgi:hypothetical protein
MEIIARGLAGNHRQMPGGKSSPDAWREIIARSISDQ